MNLFFGNIMAGTMLTIKLSRTGPNQPWGFRLQGGKDFSTPLSVQKVTNDSLAEKAGLQPGDAILKINNLSTENMRHKDAQDTVVKAGNNFEITLQRGAVKVWKPTVTPLPELKTGPKQHISSEPRVVTKTSLAANPKEVQPIGSSHNLKATPFGVRQVNGDTVTALVHKQYNSPAGLYSMQNIADTLTQQAEVLSTGAVGFNFMKSNPPVNKDSAVYRMVCEEDTTVPEKIEPDETLKGQTNTQEVQSRSFKVLQKALDNGEDPAARLAGLRHVEAPKPVPSNEPSDQSKSQENICAECGRLIVGVFVRIKDKSLHADCFKCTTCGASLRNVGYYNINNKLYCDVHARQVARHHAPTENLVPVTVPPGGALPKEEIVGYMSSAPYGSHVSSGTASSGTQFTSLSPSKPSTTTPLSVAVDSHLKHPQTAPYADAHKPVTGGSKFVWPPAKQSEPAETVIETALSPTIPTYRAPPSTQHVQFTSAKFKQQNQQTTSTPSPKASPSFSPLIPSKPSVPATPLSAGPTLFSPSVTGPKPFSPLNVSAKHVAAPVSPGSPGVSAWVPTSPIGATTKPLSVAPTAAGSSLAGSRPAPRRGRGILNPSVAPGTRIPICAVCGTPIRGPFVTALGKTWCAEHFHCINAQCRRPLQDIGFVEEQGQLYCEHCYETYLAPVCNKCNARIKGDCLNAIGKQWHPDCFVCANCRQPFGNSHFYLEDGLPYCEKDWNELFTTKCVGCGFPIEAGDRWVEALNSNYHSQCFKCTICHKNLEGQSFYAKGGRPFCKTHAR